jgi:hypothetical protein
MQEKPNFVCLYDDMKKEKFERRTKNSTLERHNTMQ